MPKKKQLTIDPTTGKLSRLRAKDLPLVGIDGLDGGDQIAPFGSLTSDVIEYHVYDLNDKHIASNELNYPLPTGLDIGAHLRGLGYTRGTYKIVYNFLRQIGGSNSVILTKKSDKTIWTGQFMIRPNGTIVASHNPLPDIEPNLEVPLLDNKGKEIKLLVQDDKYWIQEISPSRTEIRLRPNPAINDPDYFEQFRLLGYTCLSYSDVSGTSFINLDGNTATITGGLVSLTDAMKGGTIIIREAFIIDTEETPEVISRYVPLVETAQFPPSKNLITNGHFPDIGSGVEGTHILQRINANSWGNNDIVEFVNPGHSKYCLRMTSVDGSPSNQYRMRISDLIPGETYIASCWVMWTDDWDSLTDQGIIFIQKNDGSNILNYTTHGIVSEERTVNGQNWKRLHESFTAEEDTVLWILGYNNGSHRSLPDGSWMAGDGNTAGYRYFTDIQLEPGSTNASPSPYMEVERVEEEDLPTTGHIKFTDTNTVQAILSDEDDGFNGKMSGAEGGGQGVLTIKDAYVVDEVFSHDTEVIVIDDITVKNSLATDMLKYEREFRVSPYHGAAQNNKIILQVDNAYDLYSVNSSGGETLLGSGTDWRTSDEFPIPSSAVGLRVNARNGGGPGAIIAKIWFNGDVVKTGDGFSAFDAHSWKERWIRDGFSAGDDIPSIIRRFTTSTGPWNITSFTDNDGTVTTATTTNPISWHKKADAGKGPWGNNVHPDLSDCEWIWSIKNPGNEVINWSWTGGSSLTELIWQYWDPKLHSDAVKPASWGDGFNSFNWGGNENRKNDQSRWHSGWLGYHAKWVAGEGQFGETAMKFIDQNSEFDSPNHTDYIGMFKTGFAPESYVNSAGNTITPPTTLAHRWLGIAQTLPHLMSSQGIRHGDKIRISWWQKSDTINKGAMVGLYHYQISGGNNHWGPYYETHPSTIGDDANGEPMLSAGEREFLRYRPVAKVGEWEQVSYTGVVWDDWDLSKPTVLYVYGHYGPEGILWVENVTVDLVEETSKVNRTPVTADLVAPITTFYSDTNDTIEIDGTYESLAPENAVFNNNSNIGQHTIFKDFYVNYTSSLYFAEPVYGSLRGEIENVSENTITLTNTYSDLATDAGHDFDKYSLSHSRFSDFTKWFIQYPIDSSENLSKLLRLGENNFDLITNFKVDNTTYPDYPYSVVYKLYEPLPSNIGEKDFLTVVREMIPPVEETCTVVPFVEEWISDIVLRSPERGSHLSPIGNRQTGFKDYNQLVSTDANIKENIESEVLSGSFSAEINVDHSQYVNFIHFSSAEQRLKNFKYKLDLIEQYTDRSASLAGTNSGSSGLQGIKKVKADPNAGSYLLVSGSSTFSPSFTPISGSIGQIQYWEKKRLETVNMLDKYEKYLFNQTSSYSSQSIGIFHENTWPKESGAGTYSNPYILYRTSQSIATTWYANQLISASAYDKANKNRLKGHLPMHVQDDDENDVFLKFVDMIGHHFDDTWTFIAAMTDVHDKRDKLTEGIAKNLLEPVAKSLGWTVQDGKDLITLPQYMFGMMVSGSEKPTEYSVTPDRDISREIWSRIVNNMPYFLKTKGTSRAIKGLVSCYGIPSSVFYELWNMVDQNYLVKPQILW